MPLNTGHGRSPATHANGDSLPAPAPFKPVCIDLWWAVPDLLAGMSMPYVHPFRYDVETAALTDFDDELPVLWHSGIRAIVGLLNIPGAPETFRSAGFDYCWLPIVDGGIPTREQFDEFLRFMRRQAASRHLVAAHCVAGLGRTGVLLAAYLVAQGQAPQSAVLAVRSVRPGAVETRRQVEFLFEVETWRDAGELPSLT
ncbi:dual specificity protein phosphatase family protein [Verrucomicrobium sp. BvORR034]|jgi:hypothetical protein|uniref:phosphatase domain-containing putative toxin n=1 Tax=Verrucomicrobium sp. BvORR034 TaxID=1396418 RepID=UPI000678F3CE|nr:dual specificity protein phosphatase family protein [Verrucomicrobium sp. BvORR034]